MLDIFEAAGYLAISEADVHRLINRGELPVIREDSKVRFRQEDLESYLIRKSTMTKWEYLFIEVLESKQLPRPATVNGEPLSDWKKGPSIYEFSAELGEEGWELVSTHDTHQGVIVGMIFKRPRVGEQAVGTEPQGR